MDASVDVREPRVGLLADCSVAQLPRRRLTPGTRHRAAAWRARRSAVISLLATYLLTYGFTTYLGPREADEDAILRRDGLVDGAPAAVEAARDDGAQPRHVDEARLAHAEALRDDLHLVRGAQVAVAARHHREVDLDR
eukprot:scaffold104841_cov63-Phaeocystis_antarctica.AAC.1